MRILIIHTAFIGDIVLSTPLIKKIHETYENSHITYVTTPTGAEILKNNPNINEIIVYDKKGKHRGIRGVLNLGKRLRYSNFNIVIVPHRYLRSSLLSWLTRSPNRIGYDVSAGSFLYTKKIKYNKSLHEVEKLLSFLDGNEKRYEIELYPSNQDKQNIDNLWKQHNLKNKKIICLAPGSKWFTKQWPIEYFNEIIQTLNKDNNLKILVVGGNDEKSLDINTNGIIDLRGKTSLLELAEIFSRSNLVLTNDSSPIHIASAFKNTKIFAIFGPTVKEFGFFPWSKNCQIFEIDNLKCRPCGIHGGKICPQKHFKCMKDIKPKIIIDTILKYLNEE